MVRDNSNPGAKFCFAKFGSEATLSNPTKRRIVVAEVPTSNPIKPMWHVYILKCSDGSFYTGATTDISRRVKEHNNKKGGSYTRSRLPVRLLYQENYPTKSQALKREIQIKGLTRNSKLALIKKDF